MTATLANISSVEIIIKILNDSETLGIHFLCDQEQVIKQNFHERLKDVQNIINL